MSRILVVTSSETGGDINVTMALALGLRQRGHIVHVIGDDHVVQIARNQGLEATGLDAELKIGYRMVRATRQSKGMAGRARGEVFRQTMLEWACDVAAGVSDVAPRWEPDLLIASLGIAPAGQIVAAESGIPWAVVSGTFYVGPGGPRPLEQDISGTMLPIFETIRRSLEGASLVLHGTWPAFDYGWSNLPPTHRYVGPLFWEPPSSSPGYLAEPGDPWVLATLSSMTQDDVPLGRAILDALRDAPVRVLLTVGTGSGSDSFSPVPANAHIEPHVPHSAVLQRSSLFVSHGGAGAVMKALWFGVPMVLVPWGGMDRPGVAARAEYLGAAHVINRADLTPGRLGEAVKTVLADDRYHAAAREASQAARTYDAVARACDHVEQLLDASSRPSVALRPAP